MASPFPASPTAVFARVFGKDLVATILAQDTLKQFERNKDQIPFAQTFDATLNHQNFHGMAGQFKLFSDKETVSMRLWFRIAGEKEKRVVDVQKAELTFPRPFWGGEYFYYCPDDKLQARYAIEPISVSDYAAGVDKADCYSVKRLELSRVVIEEDSARRPDVNADIKIEMRLPAIGETALSISERDIDKIIYGAFVYAGIYGWVSQFRRSGDVTAVLAGFFESFVPDRTTAPKAKP